jgi:hypothetical protein
VGVTSGATSGGGAAARAAQSMAKHSDLLNGVKIRLIRVDHSELWVLYHALTVLLVMSYGVNSS